MKLVYGVVVIDGKKVRKPIIIEDRECKICKKMFTPKRQDSHFCSRNCQKKGDYQRNADHYKASSKKYYRKNLEVVSIKRKERYYLDPEKYKEQTKEWYRNNKEKALEWHKTNKDIKRHGGVKQILIEENGKICSVCGKGTDGKDLHAHHSTFDKTDHDNQVLVCNSCHGKIHVATNPIFRK